VRGVVLGPVAIVGNRYELGILARLGLVVAIAFGAMALAGALVIGADAVTRVFTTGHIDISDPPYRS
jgi:hypothetical protein